MSRILYVYDGKMTDVGIDAVVRRQLEALVAADFQVDLVARGPARIAGVAEHIFRHSLANLISWLPRPYYYGAQRRNLTQRAAAIFKKAPYSLVIAWPQRALHAFSAASAAGVPCLLNCDTLHFRARRGKHRTSHWPEISPAEMEAEYAAAWMILVPSEYSRQTFIDLGISEDKLTVLGRGIDPARFSPSPEPRVDSTFRLVFCGRVTERKGIRQIVDAWHMAALEDAEMLVVGEVADDAKALVAQLGRGNIRFLGFQKEPAAFLQQCDVQILLSRTEGMAKSLLEGAACGLATLATEESGFPLENGVNGFFVDRKKTSDVAEKLRFLSTNRPFCKAMGEAGRETILGNYTVEKFSTRFLEAVCSCSGLAFRKAPGTD